MAVPQYAALPGFLKPPCDPGLPDFPDPVLTLGFRIQAFPPCPRFKCWQTYSPVDLAVCLNLSLWRLYAQAQRPALQAQRPAASPLPPGAQRPFALIGRYPIRRAIVLHVRGHCPPLIATTTPCANPRPSRPLRLYPIGRVFAGCCHPCWE